MKPISRREFSAIVAAGAVAGRWPPALAEGQTFGGPFGAAVTAGQIIQRIQENVGVAWRDQRTDTIKAGDSTTVVTGVVTTSMATLDVLRQAVEAGANMIITAQPTFYSRSDSRTPRAGGPPGAAPAAPAPPDPIFAAKNEFIDTNRLVVFRFSDHWRERTPNPFEQGMAETLGLGAPTSTGNPTLYEVAPTTLESFVSQMKFALNGRGGIRVVGAPQTTIRTVAVIPGTSAIADMLATLPAADLVIAGEIREWESSEYARDLIYSGAAKGLALVGRVVSDEPGMAACARWLEGIVTELPVRHIAAGDPYWRPAS